MSDLLAGIRTRTGTAAWTLNQPRATPPTTNVVTGTARPTLATIVSAGTRGTYRADAMDYIAAAVVVIGAVGAFFLHQVVGRFLGGEHFGLARAALALIDFPAPAAQPIIGLVGVGLVVIAGILTAGGTRVGRGGAITLAAGAGLAVVGAFLTLLIGVLIIAFYVMLAVLVAVLIFGLIALLLAGG